MIYKVMVNAITLSRIPLSILFTYNIISNPHNILLHSIIFAIIGMTDLVDGKLARKLSVNSKFGAMADVFSDLFFIITASIILAMKGLLPLWMLIIIMGKFLEFWSTSSYLQNNERNSKIVFTFDRLGRLTAVAFYILPYITVLAAAYIPKYWSFLLINEICVLIALAAVISSFSRINGCIRNSKQYRRQKI